MQINLEKSSLLRLVNHMSNFMHFQNQVGQILPHLVGDSVNETDKSIVYPYKAENGIVYPVTNSWMQLETLIFIRTLHIG